VLQLPEASTSMMVMDRQTARSQTGLLGQPTVLWVGRLNANKDPLTALAGLEIVFRDLTAARCSIIYSEAPLEREVQNRITTSSVLRDRVTMVGQVRHEDIGAYYSASDLYISASHHEGSGYALIEALACGLLPVVTDIPAFRAIVGSCGALWRSGDPAACAEALRQVLARPVERARAQSRAHFASELSWPAVAARTLAAYRALAEARARARP
jgi:glycosyltransferase involved in cell wall biosynthesis